MKMYSKILSALLLILAIAACNDDDDVRPDGGLVAVAGSDKGSKVNDSVTLDGSASYAKDDKPFSFFWSVKTRPQESVATINHNDSVKATFVPDVVGLYVIQLRIHRNQFSAQDELRLTVTADDPHVPVTVILDEDIDEDTELHDIFEDPSQPDYLVTTDIDVRASLIIKPGVTIAVEENKGLQILTGSIQAVGTTNKGIVFQGAEERPAYWKGIVIHTNSELNELKYVHIKQAGSNSFTETGINSNLTLAGTSINGAALKVSESKFSEGGGYGLYVQGRSLLNQFSNNTFLSNATAAAYIPAGELNKLDGSGFSDANKLETGGLVLTESGITWKKLQGAYYLVTNDIEIKGAVTVEPGAIFRMKSNVTIAVSGNGYLNASGSEDSKIVFTSEGSGVRWNGLFFNSYNGNNIIKHTEVLNAGKNVIRDAAHAGNIVIGDNGFVKIENSLIKDGTGYGVVTKHADRVNQNVLLVNTFENLLKGKIFPSLFDPGLPSVNGTWVDQWSFVRRIDQLTDNFYNKQNGIWYGGAANPWAMNAPGFGLHIEENGQFTWLIAEHSPMTGCESYSTEFITGDANINSGTITLEQNYWRSRFINSCDETQNVDTEVEPIEVTLPYEITRMYDVSTGEQYWELKVTNPDQSTFSLYRREGISNVD